MEIFNLPYLQSAGLVTDQFTSEDYFIFVKKDSSADSGYRNFAIKATDVINNATSSPWIVSTGLSSIKADNPTGLLASGDYAVAEGNGTIASGISTHAEGYLTLASGDYSHAEGGGTIASGYASHAEGSTTNALGNYSHAEGFKTQASGEASHTSGEYTFGVGKGSTATGIATLAYSLGSIAEGNFCLAGATMNYLLQVAGKAYDATTKTLYVRSNALLPFNNGDPITWTHSNLLATFNSIVSGAPTYTVFANGIGYGGRNYTGYTTIVLTSDPTGGVDDTWANEWGFVVTNIPSPTNFYGSNAFATAKGVNCWAQGPSAFASGYYAIALGQAAHSLGLFTEALGYGSIATGQGTIASGNYSHAGGYLSTASGSSAFVHGNSSQALGTSTIVLGDNIIGTEANTVYLQTLRLNPMTTVTKNAITAANGMVVYDSTLNKFQGYENGAWTNLI